MINDILKLSKKLITIRSVPENLQSLGYALDTILVLFSSTKYSIEVFEKNGYRSALIYKAGIRPRKFKIILNAHLDILPGKENQYVPKIIGDKLYGVGSMDMKANAACLISVFKEVVDQVEYPLALQLVTDEEIGGFYGTKYQIDKGVRAEFVISGEATNLNIVNKAKGILWIKVFADGKTAHSAYPWNGKNAVLAMNTFLENLQKVYPTPLQQKWVTTCSVSNIETKNKTFNKIPDSCEAWLDIRYIPEDLSPLNSIRKLLPKGFRISIIENEPPLLTSEDNEYIKRLQNIGKLFTNEEVTLYDAQGSSDVRHFGLVKCEGIEFGPKGGGIGTDKEWVNIPSLQLYSDILIKFLRTI